MQKTGYLVAPINKKEKSEQEKKFLAVFETLVKFNLENPDLCESSKEYLKKMMEYTIPKGKFIRAKIMIETFELLTKGKEVTEEEIYNCFVVAWCIEWMQTSMLIADDIMDRSEYRRGDICWYKCKGIEEKAINDTLILLSQIDEMINHYCKNNKNKNELKDLIRKVIFKTEIGQLKDLTFNNFENKELDLSMYTMENYKYIAKFKTAFYTFYLPLALALIYSGKNDPKLLDETKNIALMIGEYFQIQDDYLDCYGDSSVIGKIGRDIEEGKCCWLSATALEVFNEEQKSIFAKNYGQDDPKKVRIIKDLYKEIKMEERFFSWEKEAQEKINSKIDGVEGVNKEIFYNILKKLTKRRA